MRLSGDPAPATMSSSGGGSGNFLLVPIPEYPLLDCVPNKTVKIVVLGASNVGKTALIVRFLTKRFIGDYEANTGALYSRKVALDGEEVSLQIQDTPCVTLQDDAEGLHCQEQINRSIYWADGYVLVYSITDLHSYRTIQPLYQHVRRIHPSGNIPVILVNPRGKQERPAEGPAGPGGGGRGARGYARRVLLRGLGQREPRGSPRHLPPPLSGGGPGAGGGQRGEAQRRPPPGPTQVPQHAGAEEEVQTGPLLQGQVVHRPLTLRRPPRTSRPKSGSEVSSGDGQRRSELSSGVHVTSGGWVTSPGSARRTAGRRLCRRRSARIEDEKLIQEALNVVCVSSQWKRRGHKVSSLLKKEV